MCIADKHQIQIAKQTLKYSDVGAFIMGGMTKETARKVLHDKAGWSIIRIQRLETWPAQGNQKRMGD